MEHEGIEYKKFKKSLDEIFKMMWGVDADIIKKLRAHLNDAAKPRAIKQYVSSMAHKLFPTNGTKRGMVRALLEELNRCYPLFELELKELGGTKKRKPVEVGSSSSISSTSSAKSVKSPKSAKKQKMTDTGLVSFFGESRMDEQQFLKELTSFMTKQFGDGTSVVDTGKMVRHINASEQLSVRASSFDLTLHDIPRRGNCFFEAMVDQFTSRYPGVLEKEQGAHYDLRQAARAHILEHWNRFGVSVEGDKNKFILQITKDRVWAEDIVVVALVEKLDCILVVIRHNRAEPTVLFPQRPTVATRIVTVGYEVGVHYQSLQGPINTGLRQWVDEKRREFVSREHSSQARRALVS
jgi:hypothetical protein